MVIPLAVPSTPSPLKICHGKVWGGGGAALQQQAVLVKEEEGVLVIWYFPADTGLLMCPGLRDSRP